jgi:hypothetical protein
MGLIYDFFSFVFYYGCNGQEMNYQRREQELRSLLADRLTLDDFLKESEDETYRKHAAETLKIVTTKINAIENEKARERENKEKAEESLACLRVFALRQKYDPAERKPHPSF